MSTLIKIMVFLTNFTGRGISDVGTRIPAMTSHHHQRAGRECHPFSFEQGYLAGPVRRRTPLKIDHPMARYTRIESDGSEYFTDKPRLPRLSGYGRHVAIS